MRMKLKIKNRDEDDEGHSWTDVDLLHNGGAAESGQSLFLDSVAWRSVGFGERRRGGAACRLPPHRLRRGQAPDRERCRISVPSMSGLQQPHRDLYPSLSLLPHPLDFTVTLCGPLYSKGLGFRTSRSTYFCRKPCSNFHSFPECSVYSPEQEVVIALGSNVGDRVHNFNEALGMMKKSGITITRHGCLYESEPAYVTDQPFFLNSAIRGTTKLGPHELLKVLKQIEKDLGRKDGIRYGPRPIDLDILFYGKYRIESEYLTVPHERIFERPFVVAPLLDLLGSSIDNDNVACWHSFSGQKGGLFESWEKQGGESLIGTKGLRRVLPIGNSVWDWSRKTHVMGVLNLTPDSFSDGGKYLEVKAAVSQVRLLISEGADIIDIGAQSTRPNASQLSADEELQRLIPILDVVTKMPEMEGNLLSVDTFYSQVASEAVNRGVHIVNDVSGGQLDPEILKVVGELGVPYIVMHMRGDPLTMQSKENLQYHDVCGQVAFELYSRLHEAELAGIPIWRIIVDPGIGFSKDTQQNLNIIMGLPSIRRELGKKSLAASHLPILFGPSRKGFLGEICNRKNPVERDPATIAAVTAGVLGGANIVRVHNVGYCLDAAKVCDALLGQQR